MRSQGLLLVFLYEVVLGFESKPVGNASEITV